MLRQVCSRLLLLLVCCCQLCICFACASTRLLLLSDLLVSCLPSCHVQGGFCLPLLLCNLSSMLLLCDLCLLLACKIPSKARMVAKMTCPVNDRGCRLCLRLHLFTQGHVGIDHRGDVLDVHLHLFGCSFYFFLHFLLLLFFLLFLFLLLHCLFLGFHHLCLLLLLFCHRFCLLPSSALLP